MADELTLDERAENWARIAAQVRRTMRDTPGDPLGGTTLSAEILYRELTRSNPDEEVDPAEVDRVARLWLDAYHEEFRKAE